MSSNKTSITTTNTNPNTLNDSSNRNNVTPLPATYKSQTAKEVIAANVKLLIEQLEAGHSEGLTAYLTAMGRFHNYSFGNILEIARQMPSAQRVAGLYAWKKFGRNVMKGQKGIRILAPMIGFRKKKDREAEKDITKQNQPILVGFRAAYVFDVSQTDGAPLPELAERVKGEVGVYRERLVIEAMDESGPCGLPALSIAHYGEQNGDLMRDPEMCFELGFAGDAHLNPFYWRNDYVSVEQWSRFLTDSDYTFHPELYRQHIDFAKVWDRNLRSQSFLEAFDRLPQTPTA